ncbi:component of the counting factor complex [Cavenderia fasciculata]|uniref:Component of the counting factor complex n=1 Tax=Cavenderia fasciculata TaxID=261658 RepID=F4PTW1_CACFS|nr:component of the counting factor complex [Cavenderia fasciculata]EGG20940.1 component of the counting factor complex [Cavenderia fasciculata]|eukprot:XP_004358790.1 component of the counting factor complex [Cavenderia fasciculata]
MSKAIIFTLAIVALSISSVVVNAYNVVDVDADTSGTITLSQFQCLAQQNEKIIIEAWSGGIGLNKNLAAAYQRATAAKLQVDLYAFFCSKCDGNNPVSNPIKTLKSYFMENDINFGTLWIEVEQCDGCWSGSVSENAQFVVQTVKAAISLQITIGIYSSVDEWAQTVGSFDDYSALKQWYAHYDGVPSFNDTEYYSYGGWTKPTMKQYIGNTQQCGVNVDLNYFAGFSPTTVIITSGSHSSTGTSSSTGSSSTSGSGSATGSTAGQTSTSGSSY